jgi:transcription antitermination protein NusB
MTQNSTKSSRRKAREDALQILYQLDMNQGLTAHHGMIRFEANFSKEGITDEFTQRLINGVALNIKEIDEKIKAVSEHWKTGRMAAVDRNILRLGVYELEFCDDIPATVSINEMIEVAKQFGSENSPAFINGILDKIKTSLNRPDKAP